ncbi:MAG: dihydrofolate reductase family protein [Pseudomonadota bacterium]|nr:dihydrofolate reductase family protein [Pseudomonadota bacterium]
MDPQFQAFIATSQDGYIARADGAIDWLERPEYAIPGEDFGYAAFMAGIDLIAMGRASFEKVLDLNGWFYGSTPVLVVCTARDPAWSAPEGAVVRFTHDGIKGVMTEARAAGARGVYVDGGRLVSGFLRAGLLDRLIVTRLPVLLGSGIPLFSGLDRDIRLRLESSQSWPNGFEQSTFTVLRE